MFQEKKKKKDTFQGCLRQQFLDIKVHEKRGQKIMKGVQHDSGMNENNHLVWGLVALRYL